MRRPAPRPGISRRACLALVVTAAVGVACGANAGDSSAVPSPSPPAVGWAAEVDDAPYVAYERVSYERLPRERVEPAGEVRLPQQVRRISAFRLRDSEDNAIRFTDDGGHGWLAWQPSILLRVRRDYAQESGAQPSQVTTLGVWRVLWPDGCLGVPSTGITCGPDPTPGFRISLRIGTAEARYHTDLRERVVRAPA
jgi:hypothetical protein